ncbi:MAG: hypothetical protein P8M04_01795 [Akkermansiaceae bacterium]|jgi:hypothetical protein|nr:hypothetical protein [Akkermansiaceae bacterium]
MADTLSAKSLQIKPKGRNSRNSTKNQLAKLTYAGSAKRDLPFPKKSIFPEPLGEIDPKLSLPLYHVLIRGLPNGEKLV